MSREMRHDINGWYNVLKYTLYQTLDVILIGEISDRGAMKIALAFAEIGHFGMANLLTNSFSQAFDRNINFPLKSVMRNCI